MTGDNRLWIALMIPGLGVVALGVLAALVIGAHSAWSARHALREVLWDWTLQAWQQRIQIIGTIIAIMFMVGLLGMLYTSGALQ